MGINSMITTAVSFVFFSKESKKQLKKIAGKSIVGLLGRYMNTYLVEAIDGAVVTTGYRQRQIKR